MMNVTLALATLYVARKYCVMGLERSCSRFLGSSLTPQNVFQILDAANFYPLPSLVLECWEFIEDKPGETISANKELIDQELIISVLKNDKLNIKEVELFEILME
jgi:hypothetical protein